MKKSEIYKPVWRRYIEQIKLLFEGKIDKVVMNEHDFTSVGGRTESGYNFRLRFLRSSFNLPTGSAVGRDLSHVIDENPEIIKLAKQREKDIRMKDFELFLV